VMSELDDFRHAKDHAFAHDSGSPLPDEERSRFAGLSYYPFDPALRIAADVEPPESTEDLTMSTSTGDEVVYRRTGLVRFTVDGQPAQLTLFEDEEEGELFVPFRDSTSGVETYGAGRYLEVAAPQGGRVTLDFNYAYNPYCAYSEAYSCPLAPGENWLRVPVRAGEKVYEGHPA
jgi:uncharacterized protein (DUF1684 family)